jgi:glutamate carboxypeptidase
MLKDQPFRIDRERAYGLAIADDKQGITFNGTDIWSGM